jgi:hypothetical protein
MDEELQNLLESYQQIESELLKRINQLQPRPSHLPELPLERLFHIKGLLSNTGVTDSGDEESPRLIGGLDPSGNLKAIAIDAAGRLLWTSDGVEFPVDGSSVERVPDIKRVANAGVIPSGKKMVFVSNAGELTGTLLGTNFLPGDSVSLEVTGNDTIASIPYNATGTIFVIITLT